MSSIKMKVETKDFVPLERWLVKAPGEAQSELYAATVEGTGMVQASIAGFTPVHTGKLLASEHSIVEKTTFGARGKVMTDVRYARFVEAGTLKHGGPQRMFERGLRAVRSRVEDNYGRHIGNMVGRLR